MFRYCFCLIILFYLIEDVLCLCVITSEGFDKEKALSQMIWLIYHLKKKSVLQIVLPLV